MLLLATLRVSLAHGSFSGLKLLDTRLLALMPGNDSVSCWVNVNITLVHRNLVSVAKDRRYFL